MRKLIIAALFVVVSSPALAQPDASDANRTEAERLTLEANRAHETGDFDRAVALYKKALARIEEPELHYNLGQSYRFGKKPREALEHYEKYLELEPDGRVAGNARRFVELLRAEISKSAKNDKEVTPADPKTQAEKSAVADPVPAVVTPADRRDSPGLRIAGLAVAGVGVVGVGAGIFYGLRARRLSDELSETDRALWTPRDIDKFSEGEDAERNGIALGVAGGALVAGGIILYLVGRSGSEAESQPTVSVSPDGVNVVVSGRF